MSAWFLTRSFHKGYKVMDLAADELITAVTIPRGRYGWAADVPQGGHAARPGDFESLFCRRNDDLTRAR